MRTTSEWGWPPLRSAFGLTLGKWSRPCCFLPGPVFSVPFLVTPGRCCSCFAYLSGCGTESHHPACRASESGSEGSLAGCHAGSKASSDGEGGSDAGGSEDEGSAGSSEKEEEEKGSGEHGLMQLLDGRQHLGQVQLVNGVSI